MSKDREFDQMLDEIPVSYPYEFIQKLKELEEHVINAEKVNERVAFTMDSNSRDKDIGRLIEEIRKPTHKSQALKIINEINDEINLFENGSGAVLKITSMLYNKLIKS